MDGDEIRLRHELLERNHAYADLRGPRRLNIGVVGDEFHAERRQALSNKDADTAEPYDPDGLLR